MSEEKLTVAELLARRNQERGDSDGAAERPRRRRRSLEEGGVSVAELTGSIPRVEAEGPRRGAHAVADDLSDAGVRNLFEDLLAVRGDCIFAVCCRSRFCRSRGRGH